MREARSQILLHMVAGLCCRHGTENLRLSDDHLDQADSLRRSLPTIDARDGLPNMTCTVFSTMSKRNEQSEVIRSHIDLIRDGRVLLYTT